MSLLEVTGLHAAYGAGEVLHGVDLAVDEGDIACLIGANGAGKSTTLGALSGIVTITGGEVILRGEVVNNCTPADIVRRGMIQVPEGRRIFSRLTVRENLVMGAYVHSRDDGVRHDLAHVYSLFPILEDRQSQLGGTLSGGEQQMLAIGRALMSRPRVLLLDEPSLGLAPLLVDKIFEIIREINKEGVTIFLVEQNAHLALETAAHGYVMETGRITLADTSAHLLADEGIRKAYLGER